VHFSAGASTITGSTSPTLTHPQPRHYLPCLFHCHHHTPTRLNPLLLPISLQCHMIQHSMLLQALRHPPRHHPAVDPLTFSSQTAAAATASQHQQTAYSLSPACPAQHWLHPELLTWNEYRIEGVD